ncbi:MAG: DUF3823 domain-containing protein [Mediterranea sp.]|jgi:hypothetical protein|nr:DUF3823 domain-containing protein [Mediterranea sp.]
MKKFIFASASAIIALLATSCMEVDNFDAPDCHVSGTIVDSTTGEGIVSDRGDAHVRIWEVSYKVNPGSQDLAIKEDGTFNNTKLFAGTYDMVPEGAWWPVDTIRVGIGKNTTQNFDVTPYLKLIDFKTELVGTTLTMSCRLDAPVTDGLPQVTEVRPFLSFNQFCGASNCISYYNTNTFRVSIMKTWDKIEKAEDGKSQTYTVSVPLKAGYIYFARMGARVKDKFEKYNYTGIVQIEVPSE